MTLLLRLLVAAVAFAVGLWLPDVDQSPIRIGPVRLWSHRSAWTHGPLLPGALAWAALAWGGWWWWAAMGMLPALALHLLADCFPKKWRGGAVIKLAPLQGALPGWLSLCYLAGSAWACVWLVWRII